MVDERPPNVSVCMATYNGSRYLREQVESILRQLSGHDELIMVDDCSTDSTVEIARSFRDPRINITINDKNLGVNDSFERAIIKSRNEIILLADQDDIWAEGRVNAMLEALREPSIKLVSGNSRYIDANGRDIDFPIPPLKGCESGYRMRNLARIFRGNAGYFGCAMGFKRELVNIVVPFPGYIESHDLWIAKAGILEEASLHLDAIVLLRRVHGQNASILRRSLYKKVWSRFIFLVSIIHLMIRFLIKGVKGT